MMYKSIYKPNVPRDASSIIILKKKNNRYYVLMGRRPKHSRFMPGIYVFPGGAVEKEDYKINKIFNLSATINEGLIKSRSKKQTMAILYAAIRETAEECGLFIAEKKQISEPKKAFSGTIWEKFIRKSLVPSIKNLNYFGRAITPTFLKVRFHARFFITRFENCIGKIQGNGELENLGWVEINEAKLLPIADVTEFLINRVIASNVDKSKFKQLYPMFSRRNNKKWVKWDKKI